MLPEMNSALDRLPTLEVGVFIPWGTSGCKPRVAKENLITVSLRRGKCITATDVKQLGRLYTASVTPALALALACWCFE